MPKWLGFARDVLLALGAMALVWGPFFVAEWWPPAIIIPGALLVLWLWFSVPAHFTTRRPKKK